MSLEIEAKMKVESFDAVRDRLRDAGAEPRGTVTETNTFFDTPDRALLASDRGLRLRRRASPDGGEAFIVTHKGPRAHGPLKSREEVELTVESGPDAAALLGALGYAPVLSFEKRRTSFSVDGCSVELDELPHLGTYVEVEGPGEAAVMAVRDKLGLSDAPLIKESYAALLSDHLRASGEPATDVRLADSA